MNSVVPGSELTKEPFRWDQRIFGLVLRLPGNVPVDMTTNAYIPSAENHPLDAMCEVTGGNPSLPLQNPTKSSQVKYTLIHWLCVE